MTHTPSNTRPAPKRRDHHGATDRPTRAPYRPRSAAPAAPDAAHVSHASKALEASKAPEETGLANAPEVPKASEASHAPEASDASETSVTPDGAQPERPLSERLTWKPGTLLSPVPVVLVTSGGGDEPTNVATVAWAGTVCSDPPMLSVSLRAATLTHGIIQRTGEFVVNVPSERIVRAVDLCGVISGRAGDKFATAGLTPLPASQVKAPIVAECPIALECRVKQVLELGLHTMFVAEIVAVSVARGLVERDGRFAIERAGLVAFAHGSYFALGPVLGTFGYSVRKKAPAKKSGASRKPRPAQRA